MAELTVDEIFVKLDNWYSSTKSHGYPKSSPAEAKQAILSWHNKEQVKLLERLEKQKCKVDIKSCEVSGSGQRFEVGKAEVVLLHTIQSEITKLKGEQYGPMSVLV